MRQGVARSILIDQQKNGVTSFCQSENFDIVVIRGNKAIHIPRKAIKIEKTGDGIPVGIVVYVP